MPLINIKSIPKSKLKLIKLQAIILFCIIMLPLTYFGFYQIMFKLVWNKGSNTNQTNDSKPKGIQELNSIFKFTFEDSEGWYTKIISINGNKEEKNRNLQLKYADTFNSINLQLNEFKNEKIKTSSEIPNNGFQRTKFIEISDLGKIEVINNDLAGQKIGRVQDKKDKNLFTLIDLNSKKLGEKDLKIKDPQSDKYFYNTKLNIFPEFNNIEKDRILLVEVNYNLGTDQDIKKIDEQFKKLKLIE